MTVRRMSKIKGTDAMLSQFPGKKLNRYVPDYVIFDLETTGISPVTDAVIEISAVKVRGGQIEGEFSTLVNPERPIPFWASDVNGIYDEMVADSPVFETALRDFLDFAGDSVLVGHNIHTFDMLFIKRDAEKYWGRTVGNDYIDTLSLARQLLPQLSHHKLVDLADYYHISTGGAHRALNDCRMNQQVFEYLGKELEKARAGGARICPRCGQLMKKRSGRYGEFWGCSGYPGCRYTQNV